MASSTQRVYLHIGTPKSGTTYLQEVLWRSQASLREAGVLYPTDRPDGHFLATLDLLGITFHGHADPAVDGAWDRLAAEVREWPGVSVVSHETLAPATPEMIARAKRSLEPAEVHIVCTARDLARQLPAVWQEDIKNCGMLTFDELSRSLRGDDTVDPYFANTFWGYQDVPAILHAWATDLRPDRVHVVPLPRNGPRDTLWLRFAEILGIAPGEHASDVDVRNPSTGVVETNLLRLLNKAGAIDFDWPTYHDLVKTFLAVDVLAGRPGAVPLTLPEEDRTWVDQWSKAAVEAIRSAGYHVVGDLNDLLPTWRPTPAPLHLDHPSDADLLDAAVYALNATLRQLSEERRRVPEKPPPASLRSVLLERYEHDPRMRWMLRHYRATRNAVRTFISR